MKLRSSARRVTSLPNLDTQVADNNSATSKALRNPLVLDVVFAQLNNSDLKVARLVCREWGDVGASLLGKRAFLDINKIFQLKGTTLHLATPVHEKLTRKLVIKEKFDPSVPANRTDDVITNIFTELSFNLSEVTRDIEFYITLKKLAIAFLNGLRTLKSTQLQHISIYIHSTNWNVNKARIQSLQKLPVQQNLTSMKFEIPADTRKWGSGIHTFQPVLQVLIDSAPNLTSLDVTASFCPNLEGCKNLKVLKFCFENCNHGACRNFDVATTTVTTMLTPVRDSLIELELSYDVHKSQIGDQVRNLDVPIMSNLISLTVNPGYVYIREFFDEKHIPKLRNLTLRDQYYVFADLSTHLNFWRQHRGVQFFVLQISGNYRINLQHGEQIVHLFPAVKKLDATVSINSNLAPEVMSPFHLWDLEEARLVVRNVCVASEMARVLKHVANWKGVKRVNFENTYIKQDAIAACCQDIILYSRGLQKVEISGRVIPEVLEVVRPIFEAGGVPVELKGGVYRKHGILY
ncbi:uncharacterized protein LOC110855629 [Folsomia candida]|uniref:F-box domain-containing protein n=1 Tax=Folsomia candida TaxID=158441 RepID=A0A226DSJ2_FOLCA|nr:uncharacterized protein LOC110855629 [Folsomia candida]OXA47657.1 hypothetical protein Fcan01_17560 [Folsomia candida]